MRKKRGEEVACSPPLERIISPGFTYYATEEECKGKRKRPEERISLSIFKTNFADCLYHQRGLE